MSRLSLVALVLLAVSLTACGKKEIPAKTYATGPIAGGSRVVYTEECLNGVVYLVTVQGGIAPKLSSKGFGDPVVVSC